MYYPEWFGIRYNIMQVGLIWDMIQNDLNYEWIWYVDVFGILWDVPQSCHQWHLNQMGIQPTISLTGSIWRKNKHWVYLQHMYIYIYTAISRSIYGMYWNRFHGQAEDILGWVWQLDIFFLWLFYHGEADDQNIKVLGRPYFHWRNRGNGCEADTTRRLDMNTESSSKSSELVSSKHSHSHSHGRKNHHENLLHFKGKPHGFL